MMPLTPQQNLDIAKDRARELAKTDRTGAVYGLMGDLGRFPDLKHLAVPFRMSEGTACESYEDVIEWIDRFKLA